MGKQLPTDAAATLACPYIGVPNQCNVLHVLDTHNALKRTLTLRAPEGNSILKLSMELLPCHVGFVPSICGDHPSVCLGSIVDDGPNVCEVSFVARSNHRRVLWGQFCRRTPAAQMEVLRTADASSSIRSTSLLYCPRGAIFTTVAPHVFTPEQAIGPNVFDKQTCTAVS